MNQKREKIPLSIAQHKVAFDAMSMAAAVELVLARTDKWRVVITPNIHHLHVIKQNPALVPMYREADLLLADGWPIAWLLKRRHHEDVNRITGADLLEKILEANGLGRPLVLVGGDNIDALKRIKHRADRMEWNVHLEPAPQDEVADERERDALIKRICHNGNGGVVVLGLGAPKQELMAQDIKKRDGSGAILCVGMAINFSAGYVQRAPRWMQAANLEWAYRIIQEPTRMLPRYIANVKSFVPVILENIRK